MNIFDVNKDGQVNSDDAKQAGASISDLTKTTADEIKGMTAGQRKAMGILFGVGLVLVALVLWLLIKH